MLSTIIIDKNEELAESALNAYVTIHIMLSRLKSHLESGGDISYLNVCDDEISDAAEELIKIVGQLLGNPIIDQT